MKRDDMYRFCLQFGTDSEDEIRVGEFLESLGRKKSAIVVNALVEYLDNHPELGSGKDRSQVKISTVTIDALEERIRRLIEERLAGIESSSILSHAAHRAPSEQAKEVSQDIVDMLDDLDLFNM